MPKTSMKALELLTAMYEVSPLLKGLIVNPTLAGPRRLRLPRIASGGISVAYSIFERVITQNVLVWIV